MAGLPNQETFNELDEFQKQMQASHWAVIFLISETAAGFHILMDKLVQKELVTEEDAKEMDAALLNIDYMQANFQHIQRAFEEKYNRVRFAAENPEQVVDYVEKQNAGEEGLVDPMKGEQDAERSS